MSIIRDEDCIQREDGTFVCIDRETGALICFTKKVITEADVSKSELLELVRLLGRPRAEVNA